MSKFKVGDLAYKPKGYKFPCTIVAVFQTVAGETRVVGEMDGYGILHIFNESQLELRPTVYIQEDQLDLYTKLYQLYLENGYSEYYKEISNNGQFEVDIDYQELSFENFILKLQTDLSFAKKWKNGNINNDKQ